MTPRGEINILFTCIGRKVSVVQAFRHAMTQLGLQGSLVGTDASPLSAALDICDYRYIVPSVNDPAYIPTLLSLCHRHNITLLMPLIDVDLLILAEHKNLFKKSDTLVLVSSPELVRLCRNKRETAQFFQENGIATIRTIPAEELEEQNLQFPLFIKPEEGSGSVNSFRIANKDALSFFLNYVPNPIVQEYAKGEEYTIDALSDLNGQVINVVPRKRIEVRAGEVSKGVTVRNWHIIDATVNLLQHLRAIGPTTVQCFVDGANLQFTEINPRVGGGLPLTIAAGADYPRQIIRMALGEVLQACIGSFVDDLYMLRYEEAVYISGEVMRSVPHSCDL